MDKMESIAVLSPVEINESSLRQLLPLDKLDRKELSNPIPVFQSGGTEFYNFNNTGSLMTCTDYSLDTFLSLPFSMDEVLEEGGGMICYQPDDGEEPPQPPTSTSMAVKIENGHGHGHYNGGGKGVSIGLVGETDEEPEEFILPDNEASNDGEIATIVSQTETGKAFIRKRVYVCSEPGCDVWFIRASRFHEHIMVHNNVRPFRCSICTYKTKWKSDVKKHIKKQVGKGDQTHTNAKLVIAHDFEKDKLKKYNVNHVDKLIYCLEGTNKAPETGTSRNFVRDPNDPEPEQDPLARDSSQDSNHSLDKCNGNGNGKNKKKKLGAKKLKGLNSTSTSEDIIRTKLCPKVSGNDPKEVQFPVNIQEKSTMGLESLLNFGLGEPQLSISDPISFRQALPVPAQEFIHLVGFNKY